MREFRQAGGVLVAQPLSEGASNFSRIEISSGLRPSQRDGLAQPDKKGKNVLTYVSQKSFRRGPAMRVTSKSLATALQGILFLILVVAVAASGQDKDANSKAQADAGPKDARLTIVVTGGEEKKPVDSASVYVRFVEEHKHGRDKKIEMNLKTNQEGVCHVPVIPPGKFVIQVIADGWKTYGEVYDISQTEQTINITLARPPKWY